MGPKSVMRIAVVVGGILLIPLVAMQFTEEVDWNLADFVVMGVLLTLVGVALEVATKKYTNPVCRGIAIAVILIAFLLTWAELAVGVFGTPWAGS